MTEDKQKRLAEIEDLVTKNRNYFGYDDFDLQWLITELRCSWKRERVFEDRSQKRYERAKNSEDQLFDSLQRESILREALEYYSHPDHYEPWISMAGTHQPGVLTEGGNKAREALRKAEEIK